MTDGMPDGMTDGMPHRDASTQWEYLFMEHHTYAADPLHCPHLNEKATQCPEQHQVHTELLQNDPLSLLYTGLSLDAFQALADELTARFSISQLHPKDKLLMTLMKLRLNVAGQHRREVQSVSVCGQYLSVAGPHGGEDEVLCSMDAH